MLLDLPIPTHPFCSLPLSGLPVLFSASPSFVLPIIVFYIKIQMLKAVCCDLLSRWHVNTEVTGLEPGFASKRSGLQDGGGGELPLIPNARRHSHLPWVYNLSGSSGFSFFWEQRYNTAKCQETEEWGFICLKSKLLSCCWGPQALANLM